MLKSEIPGIVNSGPLVIGDKKSMGTPTGQKRLVASSLYLGEMFSIGMITNELFVSTFMTTSENHLRYTSSLATAVSLSASLIFAEISLIKCK